jgi:RNA polymerase sigma-70 factor, ECF subfamily
MRMNKKATEFDTYYRMFAQKLYGVAFKMVNNQQDALDIVHEGFIRAYQNWEKFRGDAAVSTWLYKITLNLSYDFLKKQRRANLLPIEKDFEDKRVIPDDRRVMESDRIERIKAEIKNLTPKQKSIFILKSYEELTYEEIAKIMHSRVGTIKATYFQVIQKIKKRLGEKNGLQRI